MALRGWGADFSELQKPKEKIDDKKNPDSSKIKSSKIRLRNRIDLFFSPNNNIYTWLTLILKLNIIMIRHENIKIVKSGSFAFISVAV